MHTVRPSTYRVVVVDLSYISGIFIITLDMFLFQYMWRVNTDVYLSSAWLNNVICCRKNPEWCRSDSWGRNEGRVSQWYNQRYLWCCMFWLNLLYYVCGRFYRVLCKSVRCPDLSVDTIHAKCGCRDLDHVALPPITASGSSKPHLKCVINRSYSRLYQVVGMLPIKVYMHALLIFLGKTVNIHPHIFG